MKQYIGIFVILIISNILLYLSAKVTEHVVMHAIYSLSKTASIFFCAFIIISELHTNTSFFEGFPRIDSLKSIETYEQKDNFVKNKNQSSALELLKEPFSFIDKCSEMIDKMDY